MRMFEILSENISKYYHVTFATRVNAIKSQGLVVGKRKIWSNRMGKKQGLEAIYLFSDPTMAVRWAHKMQYDFEKPTVIIIIENPPGEIIADDHIEASMNGRTWFYTNENIPASCITKILPLTLEMTRQVVKDNKVNLDEGRLEDFSKLAADQRYRPELAMLDAQNALREYHGGPAFGSTLEQIGDLTHRMAQRNCERMGYGEEYVAPKVRAGLRFLNNIPDTDAAKAIPNLPEIDAYAREHAKLKTYNKVQRAAKYAAVALGSRNFNEAKQFLEYIQDLITNGKYQEEAAKWSSNENI